MQSSNDAVPETIPSPTLATGLELRQKMQPYTVHQLGKAMSELFFAFTGYLSLAVGAIWAFSTSSWGIFAACIIAGGFFLVKLFIIQHDCGHSSFVKKEIWNRRIGRLVSLFTIVPFAGWKREHNIHHSQVANYDRHDIGEVVVMSVEDYQKAGFLKKLQYRIYRMPLFIVFTTPLLYYFIRQRYPAILQKNQIWSAVLNNLFVLVFYGGLSYLLGWQPVLATLVGMVYVAGAAGVFLFYVQHQFEEMVWYKEEDWDFEEAALMGSSFIKMPWLLNWLTGSIGYHHIHHYNSRVPSYRLKEAYAAVPEMQAQTPLSLWAAAKTFNLKLWSFEEQKMISWKGYRKMKKELKAAAKAAAKAAKTSALQTKQAA